MKRSRYESAESTPTVLLLGDEETRDGVAALHSEYDFRTVTDVTVDVPVDSLLEATDDAACLVLDDEIPDVESPRLLERIRDTAPDLPFILLANDDKHANDAVAVDVTDCILTDDADWPNTLERSMQSAVDRYQRLQALKDREAAFRVLAEYSADAVAVFDSDATERYTTSSFEQLTERSLGENERLFTLVHSDDRKRLEREFDELLRDTETATASIECRLRPADKATRVCEVTLTDRRDADALRGIVVSVHDITDRIHFQTELDDILGRVTDAFFAVDDDWRFTYVNDRAEELLNSTESELLSNNLWDEFPEAVGSTFYDEYHRAVETQEPVAFEEYYPPLKTWFNVRAYPSETGLSIYFRDITDRKEREQQLAAMNHFNEVFQEINRRIVQTSNRGEIAQLVCDRLVELDTYTAAWVGDIEPTNGSGNPCTKAGIGDVSEITDADGTNEQRPGPMRRAAASGEPVIVQEIASESSNEEWRDRLLNDGYRSLAVIPLVHRDTVYSVLSIYSESENAFNTHECDVLTQLGKVVGHSINAIDRKEALLSESVVETKFRVEDQDNFFIHASAELSTQLTLKGLVPQPDGAHLSYVTVEANGADCFLELAEQSPQIEHVRLVSDYGGGALFETTYSQPSVTWILSEYGMNIQTVSAEDGVATVVAEIPISMNVSTLVNTLRQTFDDIQFMAQRVQERSVQTEREFWETVESQLTDRQHATIEAAYHAGYFDWPRTSSGEEIAESMDVSLPTFSEHLRASERKLFGSLVDDSG